MAGDGRGGAWGGAGGQRRPGEGGGGGRVAWGNYRDSGGVKGVGIARETNRMETGMGIDTVTRGGRIRDTEDS